MTHRLALTVSLLLVGSIATFAQTHPGQHPPGQPHDRSSHPPMDPQQHALMHGSVLGTWTGTLTSPDGSSIQLDLAAMNGTHGKLTLMAVSSQREDIGAASDVVLNGDTLRWTQALAGVSCKASATVTPATARTVETMKGTMACPEREIVFTFAKTKN